MSAQGPLRDGLPDYHLIETMRWEPAAGFLRHDRHLGRLARSATALGFHFDREKCDRALASEATGDNALRVRLALTPDGQSSVSTHPYAPLTEGACWAVRIAGTRLASKDALLRHKTSRRGVYEAARGEFTPAEADEVLLLNERGNLCEGTITSLFVDLGDGHLAMPPLECGLLDGILRADLLKTEKAYERLLTPTDLNEAKSIFVGNSLRGLIPARFAG